jgi:hypothetical protein
LLAPSFAEDLVDLHEAEPLAIGPVARHGIEGVGDREDSGLVGDRFGPEAVRVSGPVVARGDAVPVQNVVRF